MEKCVSLTFEGLTEEKDAFASASHVTKLAYPAQCTPRLYVPRRVLFT